MRRPIWVLTLLMLGAPAKLRAQLQPPNPAGVSISKLHLVVRDVEAEKKIWITMGGQRITVDGTDVIRFPGVLVFVTKGTPTGSNAGSVLDHPGFLVQNSEEWLNKMQSSGIKVLHTNPKRPDHGYVFTSEDMRMEINPGKPSGPPIECDHIHYNLPESVRSEAQAWYVKVFGAVPPEGAAQSDQKPADVSGISLRFGLMLVQGRNLPSRGQTMDRIGFEVKNLKVFCKKLEASGVKLDKPYSKTRNKSYASAELTDPWGTTIELTEGLNRL